MCYYENSTINGETYLSSFSEFSGKSGIFPYFNRIFPVHKKKRQELYPLGFRD
jgi:hypothetical protein